MFLIITFLSLLFSIFWIVRFVYFGGVQNFFNNNIVLTNVFFIIIHILLPYMQWNLGYFRYGTYDYNSYVYSLIFVFLLNVIYTFSLLFFKTHLVVNAVSFSSLKVSGKVLFLSFFFFLIGLFCVYLNVKSIFLLGVDIYIKDRISLGVGNGLALLIAHWVYISCLLFFFIFLSIENGGKYRKISFILFIASLLVSLFYYTINSNRNSIFLLLLNLFAIYFVFFSDGSGKITYKQVRRVLVLLTLSFLIVYMFFQMGKMRQTGYTYENYDATEYSVTQALNGAFGNHENIAWLLSNDFEISYGTTYSAAITNFVPRNLWNNKPVGAGPILKNSIYPGSYVVGQSGNSSLTTGLYTEVLMNFGEKGAYLFIILIAFFVSAYLNFLRKYANGLGNLILIFTVVVFSSQFLYAEFLGFFARYIFSVIPLLICYFIQVGDYKNETNTSRHG